MKLMIRGLTGFDWNDGNWHKSELKHGVAAAEVEEVLLSEPLTRIDPLHSADEQRYVALGETDNRRLLFVAFTRWRRFT